MLGVLFILDLFIKWFVDKVFNLFCLEWKYLLFNLEDLIDFIRKLKIIELLIIFDLYWYCLIYIYDGYYLIVN